jgi:hypothetical protein
METYDKYRKDGTTLLFSEQTLDIPETGEFGTCDVVFVTDDLLHVIDYKNGYVPVDIDMNPQLMLYLCGAIAKFGDRPNYKLTVIQPNYVHKGGMIRSFEPSINDLETFRASVGTALASTHILAGKHCKSTYCPARGTCQYFLAWVQENMKDGWFPGEPVAMSDEQLADALDQADLLQGYRDELRGEAMRRMTQQGKTINGYKLVRAKQNRDYRDDQARTEIFECLTELGATDKDLYERSPVSIAGVERVVKKLFKKHGRGAWLKGMDSICPPDLLKSQSQSLTITKTTDGRKEYKRGNEFDKLK